jgi:hypothetical protein
MLLTVDLFASLKENFNKFYDSATERKTGTMSPDTE